MNFGTIITPGCVNLAPPEDSRCSDPAFRAANPDICAVQPRLVVKPSVALSCLLGSVQFKAFVVTNEGEQDVTGNAVFSSGDLNVALIGAVSGNCTGLAAGEATITATYQNMTGQADLTVMAGEDCCSQQNVALLVLVDTTRSMSQTFNGTYPTKLAYAKAAASRFISEVNETKDMVGLTVMHGALSEVLADISTNKAAVLAQVANIAPTQDATEFYDPILAAIAQLDAVTADRKVLVIISDGLDTLTPTFTAENDPILALEDFKAAGGIVMALGTRVTTEGYAMLSAMTTGGFFISAHDTTAAASLDYLSGIKGYVCAGNCTPEGDVIVYQGKLNYNGFINWNVDYGYVDLCGNGLFDVLPGNGLYVDLSGSATGDQIAGDPNIDFGLMTLKTPIQLHSGDDYRVTMRLAGNQAVEGTYAVQVRVYWQDGAGNKHDILNQTVSISDYLQQFEPYNFNFTANSDYLAYISIQQVSIPDGAWKAIGVKMDSVRFDNVTDLTMLLNDTFDTENPVYLSPKCGVGTIWAFLPDLNQYGYATGYDNCYGTGCLDSPPGVQIPDPAPQSDIESGMPPGQTTYTATKQACAQCGDDATTQICKTATATSLISQADANTKAYNTALAAANAALNCPEVFTSTQQYTAHCPAGSLGADVTASATRTSSVSQLAADEAAVAAAQVLATAGLSCQLSNNDQNIIAPSGTGLVAAAVPYPSVKFEDLGVGHLITGIQVKLNGFWTVCLQRLVMLLRGPDGTSVLLYACVGTAPDNLTCWEIALNETRNLVIDDAGGPMDTTLNSPVLPSGTYAPTVDGAPPVLPVPAPQGPYGTTLSDFIGKDPNGAWSLWVIDKGTFGLGGSHKFTGNPSWDLVLTYS